MHLAFLFSLLFALAFLSTNPRSFLTDDLEAPGNPFFNTIPVLVKEKQANQNQSLCRDITSELKECLFFQLSLNNDISHLQQSTWDIKMTCIGRCSSKTFKGDMTNAVIVEILNISYDVKRCMKCFTY